MDLAELFAQGGPLMWVILAASVVGVGVFFERLWSTQRARVLHCSTASRSPRASTVTRSSAL